MIVLFTTPSLLVLRPTVLPHTEASETIVDFFRRPFAVITFPRDFLIALAPMTSFSATPSLLFVGPS